jgi:hypothetical protein
MKDPLIDALRDLHMRLRIRGIAHVHATASAAADEIERLRAEVEMLRLLDRLDCEMSEACCQCSDLRAQLAEAREALRRYGAHYGDCSYDPSTWNDGPTPCDCGFDAFLAAAKEGER